MNADEIEAAWVADVKRLGGLIAVERAEVVALRAALEQIAAFFADEYREGEKPYQAVIVARAALDGTSSHPAGLAREEQ